MSFLFFKLELPFPLNNNDIGDKVTAFEEANPSLSEVVTEEILEKVLGVILVGR